jgi:hypothetical protein
LASPYQWPWVDYRLEITPQIGSTPQLVFGKPVTCILDSIVLCNTTDQEMFIDMYVLRPGDTPITVYRVNNLLIPKRSSIQVIEKPMTVEGNDLFYAKSDYDNNLFDCMISNRQLLETA